MNVSVGCYEAISCVDCSRACSYATSPMNVGVPSSLNSKFVSLIHKVLTAMLVRNKL